MPLSVILMYDIPPFLISIVILFAPASIEFSINSFTTEAGLSLTSPAAILFIVKSSNKPIFPTILRSSLISLLHLCFTIFAIL